MKYSFLFCIALLFSCGNENVTSTNEILEQSIQINDNKSSDKVNNHSDSALSKVVETIITEPELEIETHTIEGFIKTELYEGTLNETIKISFYLQEQEHPCGGNMTILDAMYKYENQEKWLLLNITTDQEKKNYCLVENNFTGVLFLELNERKFTGNWISPNTKEQYPVSLQKVSVDKEKIERVADIYDKLYYEIHGGC